MRLRYTAGSNVKRSRILPDRRVQLRNFLLAAVCLILAGCQSGPFSRPSDDIPPDPPVDESPEGPEEDPTVSVSAAIELLQEGEEARAEALLEQITDEQPGDVTAQLLLAQIRQPPEELLGTEFEEVEVSAGDSLSVIAERSIGNGLLFYSLAKLNDIEIPRLLQPGQQLEVPKKTIGDGVESAEAPSEADAPTPGTGSDDSTDPNQTARRLVERDHHARAYSLLLSAARAGELDDSGRATLARAAVHLAQDGCREDDPESADKYLRQASPWLGGLSDQGDFVRQRTHVDARLKLNEAEQLLARGDERAAFETLMAAREQSADLARAHGSRLTRLESILAEHYHDLALTAWRDQQVELSVKLWNRVVLLNPDFEPAVRYLERARRAQQKLESLESG